MDNEINEEKPWRERMREKARNAEPRIIELYGYSFNVYLDNVDFWSEKTRNLISDITQENKTEKIEQLRDILDVIDNVQQEIYQFRDGTKKNEPNDERDRTNRFFKILDGLKTLEIIWQFFIDEDMEHIIPKWGDSLYSTLPKVIKGIIKDTPLNPDAKKPEPDKKEDKASERNTEIHSISDLDNIEIERIIRTPTPDQKKFIKYCFEKFKPGDIIQASKEVKNLFPQKYGSFSNLFCDNKDPDQMKIYKTLFVNWNQDKGLKKGYVKLNPDFF